MQYRLRTLLIVLALGPPVLGISCPPLIRAYNAWQRDLANQAEVQRILDEILADVKNRPNGGLLEDQY